MTKIDHKNWKILEQVFESLDGLIIIDQDGKIVFINQKYAQMMNISEKEAIGKHVREVIPQTRMDIVCETGVAEIGAIHLINNEIPVVCNRIPIKHDNQVFGAFSVATFGEMDGIKNLLGRIQELTNQIQDYRTELNRLQSLQRAKYSIDQIIGKSPKIKKMKEVMEKISSSHLTTLIYGETGTGKELIAHSIHQLSPRRHKPLICINCAAIPNELLESELFGYEEGAFTGAKKNGKIGKLEAANGGTLILDEISELPIFLQSKLLRVFQEREFERVGGTKVIKLDVRLICITNKNLKELVAQGKFREDLYYRINVLETLSPPLRERLEDIELLIDYFIKKINQTHGLHITGIHPKALKLLTEYHWPGNVRELEHMIERAAVMKNHGELNIEKFDYLVDYFQKNDPVHEGMFETTATMEKKMIIEALDDANGNKTLAAQKLNIHRTVLYKKIKKYNLDR